EKNLIVEVSNASLQISVLFNYNKIGKNSNKEPDLKQDTAQIKLINTSDDNQDKDIFSRFNKKNSPHVILLKQQLSETIKKYETKEREKKLQLMRGKMSLLEEGEELKNEKEEQEQQKENIDMNKGLQDEQEVTEELNNQEMKEVSKAELERQIIANTTQRRKRGAKKI
ncbi:MAG: hypothetical protein EZS28_055312, partial [Streblomastix strix]